MSGFNQLWPYWVAKAFQFSLFILTILISWHEILRFQAILKITHGLPKVWALRATEKCA